ACGLNWRSLFDSGPGFQPREVLEQAVAAFLASTTFPDASLKLLWIDLYAQVTETLTSGANGGPPVREVEIHFHSPHHEEMFYQSLVPEYPLGAPAVPPKPAASAAPALHQAYWHAQAALQRWQLLQGLDPDHDGLCNRREHDEGKNPRLPDWHQTAARDTDGDGFTDGEETAAGSNALDAASMPPVTLEIVSGLGAQGTGQIVPAGSVLPEPVGIRAVHLGIPRAGIRIKLTSNLSGGLFSKANASTGTLSWMAAPELLTDASGQCAAFYSSPLLPSLLEGQTRAVTLTAAPQPAGAGGALSLPATLTAQVPGSLSLERVSPQGGGALEGVVGKALKEPIVLLCHRDGHPSAHTRVLVKTPPGITLTSLPAAQLPDGTARWASGPLLQSRPVNHGAQQEHEFLTGEMGALVFDLSASQAGSFQVQAHPATLTSAALTLTLSIQAAGGGSTSGGTGNSGAGNTPPEPNPEFKFAWVHDTAHVRWQENQSGTETKPTYWAEVGHGTGITPAYDLHYAPPKSKVPPFETLPKDAKWPVLDIGSMLLAYQDTSAGAHQLATRKNHQYPPPVAVRHEKTWSYARTRLYAVTPESTQYNRQAVPLPQGASLSVLLVKSNAPFTGSLTSENILEITPITLKIPEEGGTFAELPWWVDMHIRFGISNTATPPSVFYYLLPLEMTLHRRGTINAPGARINRPADAEAVYEVVTLENADWDEQENWTPNSMAAAAEANRQDGATEAVNLDRDDDFVKIKLHCPAPRMAGSIELVMDRAGQGDRMQADHLRFYDDQGNRIQLADLKIEDLQNPSGPLAPMLEEDGLDLFVEVADLGMLTRAAGDANSNQFRYADLILRMNFSGQVTELKGRVYRGGYWLNQRNGNTGTIAFYDGKGRYQDQNGAWQIDAGNLVHGPFNIRSGAGTTDETARGRGPTPVGWYGLYERLDINPNWQFSQRTQRWSRPQQDHNYNHPSGGHRRPPLQDATGQYWQQGSYSQWSTAGNRTAYTHRGAAPPPSVQFKFELVNWGHNAHGRDLLQIHPDGWNDGTLGCVGLQNYNDCCRIFFLLRHYFGTRLQIETP
ncbi:MAG TPA: hypothetical protein DIT64_11725, partial [Verrucomicrobiales bacterium]|nr:hypothetical protein [Verrucomicrobiales bacterium]